MKAFVAWCSAEDAEDAGHAEDSEDKEDVEGCGMTGSAADDSGRRKQLQKMQRAPVSGNVRDGLGASMIMSEGDNPGGARFQGSGKFKITTFNSCEFTTKVVKWNS